MKLEANKDLVYMVMLEVRLVSNGADVASLEEYLIDFVLLNFTNIVDIPLLSL